VNPVGLLVYYTPVYQVFGLKFVVKTKACCSSPRSQNLALRPWLCLASTLVTWPWSNWTC